MSAAWRRTPAISSTWTQKPVVCLEFVEHKYLILKSAAARNERRLVGLAGSYACFRDAVPSSGTAARVNKRRKHEVVGRVN